MRAQYVWGDGHRQRPAYAHVPPDNHRVCQPEAVSRCGRNVGLSFIFSTQVQSFTSRYPISVGIVNEILWGTIGQTPVQSFYLAAYEEIRKATYVVIHSSLVLLLIVLLFSSHPWTIFLRGNGSGAGPYIAIHEGFQGVGISSE